MTTPDWSEQILPRTLARAVTTDSGKTVEELLSGAGLMPASIYDSQGKSQDIFKYVDDTAAKKAGSPLIGPASMAWELDRGGILFITDDKQIPSATDFNSILKAAQYANMGKPAALNGLTSMDDIQDGLKNLRANFKGERFANVTDFKAAIQNAVCIGGTNMYWREIQYAILHGVINDSLVVPETRNYYWWENGGDGAELVLAAGSNEDLIVKNFVEAAFRTVRNGNVKAWDLLTADLVETAWLVSADNDSAKFAELPKFSTPSDLEDFKRHMNDLITAATTEDSFSPPVLNWYQVQHYLISKDYISAPSDAALDPAVYWWKHKTIDPDADVNTPLTQLVKDMSAMCYTSDETAFTSGLTLSRVRDELLLHRDDDGGNYNKRLLEQDAWPRLIALAQAAYDTSTQTIQLTWYQVQYYLINEQYVTPEAAAEAGKAWAMWAPDWAIRLERATAPVATYSDYPSEQTTSGVSE